MLLAIDVSNTNTKLGLFEASELVHSFRISTDRERTGDELGVLIHGLFGSAGIELAAVDSVAISLVVPTLRRSFDALVRRYFAVEPMFVEPGIKTGLKIQVENPAEVGADRIVNSIAAHHLEGGPTVVVDFGTATTFDVISEAGDYLGGVIAPGMLISAEALFVKAARLPLVSVEQPPRVIGKNSVHCMQSGLFFGYLGLVEGILDRIAGELGVTPRVIATGGYADQLAAGTDRFDRVEETLTLLGLRLVYSRNFPGPEAGDAAPPVPGT
jgi:type III pantothenate kinase